MCFPGFRGVIGTIIAGMALTAVAQTNSCPQCMQWFIVPKPHLRIEYAEASVSRPGPQPGLARPNSLSAESGSAGLTIEHSRLISASEDREVWGARQYYLRQPNFGLIPPARVSNDRLTRWCDFVFRPEEVHLGRTVTASCSIWTAIKRRNPLCLINVNPYFLKVSW